MIIDSAIRAPPVPPRRSPRPPSDSVSTISSVTESTELPDYASTNHVTLPPRYQTFTRPSVPVIYSFSEWDSARNCMYLYPPGSEDPFASRSGDPFAATASDMPPPLYQITVMINLDPMLPLSYVTRVFRCGPHEGVGGGPVGSFEISMNQKRRILTFGDVCTRLESVLSSPGPGRWQWSLQSVTLRWDCKNRLDDGSPLCYCHGSGRSNHDVQLASFVPPPSLESPPLPLATLTVFPDGHQYMDHIIVSALVVVRQMTAAL
ncbi:hypothetical protein BD626DRAFT_514764 [Schizophyllum amplum]|uniref:Uncharacterized protein n=1 Tax=Schizophyllum amplum TaxID=97359 RepID=A0A550BY16_9AGAR|nr:hypothetical protein BD626DRAFT_514764 [Auriculariopsis ampla]